ncbi:MAG: rhamnogalacturonan acetylesterase [Spirochaetales bacterium]|nr:rhamnogalacturonan acetylesterase [Spirochaetales bacterium]
MIKKIPSLYLCGDSTMADNFADTYPQTGWGQVLPRFFSSGVLIENHAINGRSSKSFLKEGRLKPVAEKIKSGDYLFIQFGHNDEKPDEARKTDPRTSYKECLFHFIQSARAVNAIPVLITSIHRRKFDDENKIINSHAPYHIAMKELSEKENVILLELGEKSRELIESLGPDKSKKLFMNFKENIHPNFPLGSTDDTHLTEEGAVAIARCAVEEIRLKIPALAAYIAERAPSA